VNGAERIAAERRRQVEGEGYDPEHDAEHRSGALAYAAACYAAPETIYHLTVDEHVDPDGVPVGKMVWHEPWPTQWKRRAQNTTTRVDRLDDLTKAGALIAAEIDRLLAQEEL